MRFLFGLLFPALLASQQAPDSAYTARIKELTPTDPRWKFTTELVDHLPASPTVPSPLKVLGYVPGTIGKLSHVTDINRYFKALAAAAPSRVKYFTVGQSDEGREMILVAIASEATIAKLDDYRAKIVRLSDPRTVQSAERAQLIREAKPIYWLTGSIHSPETGSPEMLMELAYRLAVEESDFVKDIRDNVITLITPVTEVDGRDRMVDLYQQTRELKLGQLGGGLIYWGKYTAHDNNRDGMVLSQKLSQNVMKAFMEWRPLVAHDLHESVPFLYTSTGTGPYNDEYDPIVVDEWHTLAYQEITELTRRGLPGVWTHGFYDGWAPNYTILAVANLHNSIGRFYETYTSSGADCQTVRLPPAATERRWDRPNPPVNDVRWCIRSNINYQQSGALVALKYTADHAVTFLENYVSKAERMIRRGQTSAPYAFVIPRGQRHASEAADLVNLFRAHGTEIHVATQDFTARALAGEGVPRMPSPVAAGGGGARDTSATREPSDPNARRAPGDTAGDSAAMRSRAGATRAERGAPAGTVTVHAGDWIVRMDQPYTATARTLLALQRYKADDPPPYDDTGWTLDLLRHLTTYKMADSSILSQPMQPLSAPAVVKGAVREGASSAPRAGSSLVVRHLGDWRSAVLPWKVGGAQLAVADAPFRVGDDSFPAGSFIVADAGKARAAIAELGLNAVGVADVNVTRHAVKLPRIALLHSWIETQNEGWVRYAFDQMDVPYTYISDQGLKRAGALDAFDVVVYPHVSSFGGSLLNGRPMIGPPLPWKKTAKTPHLGMWDSTSDMRPGMGLEGAAALRRFVERGGMLLTTGNSAHIPVDLSFNSSVSIAPTRALRASGAIFRATPVTRTSPILYGYDGNASLAVYFNQAPLFSVAQRDTTQRNEGTDPALLAEVERQRARVILKFADRPDSLLLSGLLVGGEEMAGKAAVVDAPVGAGHVVMFGIRPLWRWESQGSFALALNAIVNWNHLDR
ncbi:MAG: M14 family zinc carboxypeptidase [Gemmatimonadaceae bacterium]